MTDEEDPLSTANIGIHLLKLVILLAGGGALEAIKHVTEPPLFTNAMLNIGEFTMLVYMVGALGQAFHWSWKQWTQGKPIMATEARGLLKQLLPQKVNLRELLRLPRLLRRIVVWAIAVVLVLFVIEYFFSYRSPQPQLGAEAAVVAVSRPDNTVPPPVNANSAAPSVNANVAAPRANDKVTELSESERIPLPLQDRRTALTREYERARISRETERTFEARKSEGARQASDNDRTAARREFEWLMPNNYSSVLSPVPLSFTELVVSEFNLYSPAILLSITVVALLAIAAAVYVLIHNRRKQPVQ